MSSKTLIIVESPTKAKTLSKFLGQEYIVKASFGHIRDLPDKAADIPAKYKKEKWARLGINVENDFEPLYVIASEKNKVLKELKSAIAESDKVILATDDDREGAAIAWHLSEVLKLNDPDRIVFHEITKSAIENSLANPAKIDMKVVQAQETRRILDRLVGYTLSPLIWKKIAFGLSAGRVQSVAMKLIVEREIERMKFVISKYNTIEVTFDNSLISTLIKYKDKFIATGKDFDEYTGKLLDEVKYLVLDDVNLVEVLDLLKQLEYSINDIQKTTQKRTPAPPYITSSLQIDANRKLGFSSKQTMQIAQKLYEEGLITYMRTDSVNLSSQAIGAIKSRILKDFGKEYDCGYVRKYSSKSKGAQEAHEAIRPSGTDMKNSFELGLSGDQKALYDLIWKRSICCQMKEAELELTGVDIFGYKNKTKVVELRSTGNKIIFDGFLKVYDREVEDKLPGNLNSGLKLVADTYQSKQHETKPLARYNDASLVKKLEESGVGRPSTYASIISTIQSRGYVKRNGNQLIPTFTAFAVNKLLEDYFNEFVDLKFTSNMENDLDQIETGEIKYLPYLKTFYLGDSGLENKAKSQEKNINPRVASMVILPNIDEHYKIRVGKFGAFVSKFKELDNIDFDSVTEKSTIPEDIAPADIDDVMIEKLLLLKKDADKPIAYNPGTGEPIYLKSGRFGEYLKYQDKNFSIPKSIKNLDDSIAIKLVGLPRVIGVHKELNITANFGKFGPYLLFDSKYITIPKDIDLFEITIDQAIDLIENGQEKKTRSTKKTKPSGKDLGLIGKKNVYLMDGKYGPYLKFGLKNIKIPKDIELDSIDLLKAKEIIGK